MLFTRDLTQLEMINEADYTIGSQDNLRRYDRELLIDTDGDLPANKHGLRLSIATRPHASVLLAASGGGSGVNERSCVLLADRCLVAVGDRLVLLGLPDLRLMWEAQADEATCFGLHLTPDGRHVIVHGELLISMFSIDGTKVWSQSGADIFTGTLSVDESSVRVTDFNDAQYQFDLHSGKGGMVGKGS
jgi:hypothetical protein